MKPPPDAPERPASTNAANNAPRGGSTTADPLDGAAYNDDHARQLGFTSLTFHDEFNGASLSTTAWANTFAWGDRTLAGNGEVRLAGSGAAGRGVRHRDVDRATASHRVCRPRRRLAGVCQLRLVYSSRAALQSLLRPGPATA